MIPITCNAVGDILAIATLVLDIGRALNESRGSPSDYRALVGELNSLNIVLSSVGRVAQFTADVDLQKEIVRETDRCGTDVQRAFDRVFKFSTLGRDNDTNDALHVKLKRQWYKLEWRFGHRGHMKEVRADLATATQRLSAYLAISNADGINDLRASLTEQFNGLTANLCGSLLEHFAGMAALSRAVDANTATLGELQLLNRHDRTVTREIAPSGVDSNKAAAVAVLCVAICTMHETSRAIHTALLLVAVCILMRGMTLQEHTVYGAVGYTQSNSILLHDAMGRRLVLPLELCETRELAHVTLTNLFSRTEGCWFITARRYALWIKGKPQSYDNDEWDISPNMEVEMSIVVQYASDHIMVAIRCVVCMVEIVQSFSSTYFCSGCGSTLTTRLGWHAEHPDGALDDGAQATLKSVEDAANDCGRFPRSRPTSLSGTRRKALTPENRHTHPSGSLKPLSDIDNRRELRSSWRHQVGIFTRISLYVSIRNRPLFTLPFFADDRLGLHLAAENGHYALVQAELLDNEADVHASVEGFTALHLASLRGHTRVVELLLDHGAAIDAATEHNITPLACAVSCHHIGIVALLVARGAIVDAPESIRAAVLYAAACTDNVRIMQMLLRLGLDVNTPACGETALHAAVRCRRRESVEVLLRNGADVNVRIEEGDTALLVAAHYGNPEIFELLWASRGLANHALSSDARHDPSHLLRRAVQGGSYVIVATVLQHTCDSADPNARFADGTTPLSLASEDGYDEVVELLLAQGADPNAEAFSSRSERMGKDGAWKPLHAAAYLGRAKVIESLLRNGADVNARTEHGDTPFLIALEEKLEALKRGLAGGFIFYLNQVFEILLSWGAVMDERSTLLLEEIARLERSQNNHSGLDVPGAWREAS